MDREERIERFIMNVIISLFFIGVSSVLVLCVLSGESKECPNCKQSFRKVSPQNALVRCPHCYYIIQKPNNNNHYEH